MTGMKVPTVHEPTGARPSGRAQALRWIRLATVTVPGLAAWFVAAAVHDGIGALVRRSRHRDSGSAELVPPQVRLPARISIAQHHKPTIDRR